MGVPSSITDISTNPASNFPANTDITGETLASLPRAIQSILKKQFSKGTSIAVTGSGSITVPPDEGYYSVTGTGYSVTGLSSAFDGRKVMLRFVSAGLTLVHSGSFLLPDAANVTTKAGDIASFVQESAGTWVCTQYNSYVVPTVVNPAFFEIGTNGVTASPYIDFHSSSTAVDYDTRIISTGGTTGQAGKGNLNILCSSLQFNGEQVDSFPAGTKILFYQSAAPVGWTKLALGNNYTFITGAGGTYGGGGSAGHNIVTGCTVVASHTHTVDPANVLSGTETANHTHSYSDIYYMENRNTTDSILGGSNHIGSNSTDNDNESYARTGTTGTVSQLHQHWVNIPSTTTSANTNLDVWQPYYVTVIVASKN